MKQILILLTMLAVLFSTVVNGQNNEGKADDEARIAVTPVVKNSELPAHAKKMLKHKMTQLLSLNNMAGGDEASFFTIEGDATVLTQETTPTAPPMVSLQLSVSFKITDKQSGKVFSEVSTDVKGVGTNETKAYMTALRYVNIRSAQFRAFVDKGKERILQYYNSNCDFFLSRAEALKEQGNNAEAIKVLKAVPQVSKECYDKAMKLLGTIDMPEPQQTQSGGGDVAQSSGGGSPASSSGSEVEIDDDIYLVYNNMKTFGDKITMYFQLENRGGKDYELKDYNRDIRILAEGGIEKSVNKVEVAGKSGANTRATLMPGVPVKMECHFDKVDKVMMFEFPFNDSDFRIKDFGQASSSADSRPSGDSESGSGGSVAGAIDYANLGSYESAKMVFNKVTKWGKFKLPIDQFGNFSFDSPKEVQGKVTRFHYTSPSENNPEYLKMKSKPNFKNKGFTLIVERDNDNLSSYSFKNGYMRKLDNQRFGKKHSIHYDRNNAYMLFKGNNGGKTIYISVYFMADNEYTLIVQDVVEVQ
ncbi:hypothetical protein L21SP5_03693 [Salinivirga cyanobacteriivorans]|uniref:Uncharacterized protein n=1 Tax=Salinivirga cyanobacteriivorans TaxID=1307839 RepID=A0A0S2I509_9BACT|nr:hypothetical protein [Salinivirga cyanobacteriivorans]ALO17291.1 hypothetical protein L21SP5_03693 [Salinivirga cyanobacteriivorans]